MSGTGYQGSHRSGVQVTVYPNLGDGTFGDAIAFTGTSIHAAAPCVTGCHVTMALGQAASFSVTFKRADFDNPFDTLVPDSWIDIAFTRDGLVWHTLRGLTDEIRLNTSAGSGATSRTYTLTGRSFQKIFEDTTAYFNAFLGDLVASDQVLKVLQKFQGAPDTIVQAVLVQVLANLGSRGRAVWRMPAHMPGASTTFVEAVQLVTTGFDLHKIPRSLVSPHLFNAGGQLWSLAQQYSDPMMCELYTDLLPANLAAMDLDGTRGLALDASAMTTILRDKPFIAVDLAIGNGPLGLSSPYFSLPQFVLSRSVVMSLDVGRNSYERYNSFLLSPPPGDGTEPFMVFYQLPLWNVADQVAHGLRQMQVGLSYEFFGGLGPASSKKRKIDSCLKATKHLVMNWYAPSHTFYSGSMDLAIGAPWLKVGCRLRLVDPTGAAQPLNAYIEQVSHSYSPTGGTRTQVSFTRGFFGSEAGQIDVLSQLTAAFADAQINITGSH